MGRITSDVIRGMRVNGLNWVGHIATVVLVFCLFVFFYHRWSKEKKKDNEFSVVLGKFIQDVFVF